MEMNDLIFTQEKIEQMIKDHPSFKVAWDQATDEQKEALSKKIVPMLAQGIMPVISNAKTAVGNLTEDDKEKIKQGLVTKDS